MYTVEFAGRALRDEMVLDVTGRLLLRMVVAERRASPMRYGIDRLPLAH